MSHTFICDNHKNWYLKITNIEELLEYWNEVFNPRLKQALDTITDTKEYGRSSYKHCDAIHNLIGLTARGEHLSYEEAHDKIVYNTRISQYQAILDGKTVYINNKMGWNIENKVAEQFIHKNSFEFPKMKKEFIKIERFPLGEHYYVFIDGVQLREGENLKFNSYSEAEQYANKYIKGSKR